MIATTAITSGLGAVYWWVVARTFPVAAVGQAAAVISAMTLLGVVATIGFSTALFPRLAGQSREKASLLVAALAAVGVAGLALGALWQTAAPLVWPGLALHPGWATVLLFSVGVSLTATTLVLDQALIALLRGEVQLARNAVFAFAKLIAVVVASRWLAGGGVLVIYATWALAHVVSLISLGVPLARWGGAFRPTLPRLRSLEGMGNTALLHHGLNLALSAPTWILPMLVTVVLSSTANAYFYAAWMVAGMVFAGPLALTTVLYAVAAKAPRAGRSPFGITLVLSFAWGIVALVGCLLFGGAALHVFGRDYGLQATPVFLVLVLAVFPQAVKLHYVALTRLEDRLGVTILLALAGGVLELGLAALGAHRAGLKGLAVGWVIAVCAEAVAVLLPLARGLLRLGSSQTTAAQEGGPAVEPLSQSVGM